MPWYRVQDNQCRNWDFNPDEVARIVRSNIYNREALRLAVPITHSNGIFFPDTYSYETDTRRAAATAETEAPRWVRDAWEQARLNGEGFFQTLVHLRQEAIAAGDRFHQNSLQYSSMSQRNINSAIDTAQAAVSVLTPIRNASATTLLVGATVLSGGAALAAVGAGAGLRFTSRIEDGGTIGQAAAETGVDMFVTFITRGAGRALPTNSIINSTRNIQNEAALAVFGVLTSSAADAAKTVVTGEIGRTPLQGAQARLGVEVTNAIFTNILSRVGIPVSITAESTGRSAGIAAVINSGIGVVGDLIVNAARGISSNSNSSSGNVPANMLLTTSPGLASAEQWVRERAMRRA